MDWTGKALTGRSRGAGGALAHAGIMLASEHPGWTPPAYRIVEGVDDPASDWDIGLSTSFPQEKTPLPQKNLTPSEKKWPSCDGGPKTTE